MGYVLRNPPSLLPIVLLPGAGLMFVASMLGLKNNARQQLAASWYPCEDGRSAHLFGRRQSQRSGKRSLPAMPPAAYDPGQVFFKKKAFSPASPIQKILPPIWMIPIRRITFSRDRSRSCNHFILNCTLVRLQPSRSPPSVLSGPGGIGKTPIAIEYAYRYHQDYQAVFQVRSRN